MRALAFECSARLVQGRRVRRIHFEQRSLLPVSAACVVANGVREILGTLLPARSAVRLTEPLVPNPEGWSAILQDARIYAVRGAATEGAFIVGPAAAGAIASGVFGESVCANRTLSAIEERVLERTLAHLAPSLAAICGAPQAQGFSNTRRVFTTYFEVIISGALDCRIGVALAREPNVQGAATLALPDLADVELELHVELACGSLAPRTLLELRPGFVLRTDTKLAGVATLKLGQKVVARGACGTYGERAAFVVG